MRSLSAFPRLAALLCAGLWVGSASAQETELSQVLASLIRTVQGEALLVSSSPALCEALGRPQRPGAPADLTRWYFGSGACQLFFQPDPQGLVTRATTGLTDELASRPAAARPLDALLGQARRELATSPTPPPTLRLRVHSHAWEVGLAAWRAHRRGQAEPNRQLACTALDVVRATAFDATRAAQLPDTLPRLAELAEAPELAADLEPLLQGDPGTVEVIPPSTSHAETLGGRFMARVFLSSDDPDEAERLVRHLRDPATRFDRMGRIAFEFDDVHTILLLYFNALQSLPDGSLELLPTPLLAFWQEYRFAGRVDRTPPMPQAEQKLRFRSLALRPAARAADLRYEVTSMEEMAHKSFVDAMPPTMGSPVTTKRGVCLKCHTRVVEVFHPESRREVRFAPALQTPATTLLAASRLPSLDAELARWTKACR